MYSNSRPTFRDVIGKQPYGMKNSADQGQKSNDMADYMSHDDGASQIKSNEPKGPLESKPMLRPMIDIESDNGGKDPLPDN